jgi:hypothetical protein
VLFGLFFVWVAFVFFVVCVVFGNFCGLFWMVLYFFVCGFLLWFFGLDYCSIGVYMFRF